MSFLGPYLLVAAVLVLRLVQASRSRPVRPGRMWIVPALGIFALVTNLSRGSAPDGTALAVFIAAIAAGAAVGWLRASHTQLLHDPATGEVTSKPTLAGALLIVGFVVLRMVLDTLSGQLPGMASGAVRTNDVLHFADAGLIFSLAMTIVRQFVIWRRAAALTTAHAVTAGLPPHV
jgi:hypothetical protein